MNLNVKPETSEGRVVKKYHAYKESFKHDGVFHWAESFVTKQAAQQYVDLQNQYWGGHYVVRNGIPVRVSLGNGPSTSPATLRSFRASEKRSADLEQQSRRTHDSGLNLMNSTSLVPRALPLSNTLGSKKNDFDKVLDPSVLSATFDFAELFKERDLIPVRPAAPTGSSVN
jgi:hypothetical protein